MKQTLSIRAVVIIFLSLFTQGLAQNRSFLNSGFDTTKKVTPATGSYSFVNASNTASPQIKEWNTTASDGKIEIWKSGFNGVPSVTGTQFAELNANMVSRLYQNICLRNGETLGWSFSHRGRNGTDVMEFNIYNAAGTSKLLVLQSASTGNTAWKNYSGSQVFNLPSGAYQVSFESISSAGGNNSIGNFLDAIDINLAPVIEFVTASATGLESVGNNLLQLRVNGTVPAGGSVVTMSLSGGTATVGTDFNFTTTLNIPAGEYNTSSSYFNLPLSILDDKLSELDETVKITLVSATNTMLIGDADCSGTDQNNFTYTIQDDEYPDIDANKSTVGKGAANDDTHCGDGSAYQLKAHVVNASSVKWKTFGTGTFSNINDSSATYTPSAADLTAGSVKLKVETINVHPKIAYDSMVITFVKPVTLNQGVDTVVCQNSPSIKLYATATNYSSVAWTGGGTFTSTGSLTPTYTPSATELGQASFNLTITANPLAKCTAVVKNLKITVLKTPVVDAGSDLTVCSNNSVLTLSGTSSTGTAVWSGGTAANFQSPLTSLSNTYQPSAAEISSGKIKFYLTSTSNKSCVAVKDSVTYTFNKNVPTVSLGIDKQVCKNNNTVSLTAAFTNSSGVKWSNFGGSVSPNDSATTITYVLSATELNAGLATLIATSRGNGNCKSVSDTIKINVIAAPTVDAGADQQVCSNNTDVTLLGKVTGATGGQWSAAGTFKQGVNSLSNTYMPTIGEVDGSGQSVLVLTSTGNGVCNAVTDSMSVAYIPAPEVDAGLNTSLCANNLSLSLNNSDAGDANVFKWTTSGTGTFSPNSTILNPIYVASVDDTLLTSLVLRLTVNRTVPLCKPVSDSIIVSISKSPVVSAGPDLQICKNNPTTTLLATSTTGSGTWSLSTGATGVITADPVNKLLATYKASAQDISNGTPIKLKFTSTNNGLCTPVTDELQITFINSPTITAGTDKNVCANNSLSSITANSSTGSVLWSNFGGTLSPNTTTSTVSYQPSTAEINAGKATLIVTTQNNGLCKSVNDTIDVIIGPKPIVDAGTDINVCADFPTATISGAITNAGGGVWSSGAGNYSAATSVLSNTYKPSVNEVQAGLAKLVLISTNNGLCNAESDTVLINITKAPSVDAGNDQTICVNSSTVNISGTFSNAGGVEWSSSGTGTFGDKNAISTTYAPSATDKNNVLVTLTLKTIQNGLCQEVKDDVRILFTSAPSLDAGNDQTVCTNDFPVHLSAVGSPATWSGGTGTFSPDKNTLTATYMPSAAEISAGTVNLSIQTQNNNECPKLTDNITITIKAAPIANAGPDQSICGNDNTLNLTSVRANVKWATLDGAGSFVNPNVQNAVYNINEQDKLNGKVTFVLTTTNNVECSATRDTVVYNISMPIIIDAGPDKNVCANNAQISLNGTLQNATDANWSGGNGSFFDASALSTAYTPTSGEITFGSVELTLTSVAVGACPTFSDKVKFTITPAPTIDAGIDQSVCADVDSAVVSATINTVAKGVEWSSTGTGVFSPSYSISSPTYYFSDADLASSSVQLFAKTVASGNCNEVFDVVKINIKPKPTINLGADTIICADKSLFNVTGKVTNATGIDWTTTGFGTLNSPSGLTNSYTIAAKDKTGGLFTLIGTTSGNGLCKPVIDELSVEIQPAPTVNAGPDQVTCSNVDTISVGASFTLATGGVWSTLGSGTFLKSTNPFTKYIPSQNDKNSGSVRLVFTTTGNGNYNCNAVTDTVLIKIDPKPTANAGNDATICADSLGIALAGTVTKATGLIWSSDGTGGFFPNAITPNASFVPSQADRNKGLVHIFLTTTGNGACNASMDTMKLTILPRPTVDAGLDQKVCSTTKSVQLTGAVTNAGGGIWLTSGSGTFTPGNTSLSTTYNFSALDLSIGKVVINLNATNTGLCSVVFDQVQITIDQQPQVNAGQDQDLCSDASSIVLGGTLKNASSATWTVNGDGVFMSGTSSLNNTYKIDQGDYSKVLTFILTSKSNGVCNPVADSMVVNFTPLATIDAIDDFSICKDATGFNLTSTHTVASGVKWTTNGSGLITPNNLTNNINYKLTTADTTKSQLKFMVQTTGNGVCKSVKDSLIVSMTPAVTFDAGPDVSICADQTVIFVLSTLTVSDKVQWVSSGNGIFLPDEFAVSPIYLASPEDSARGTVRLQGQTLNNGTCLSKSDFMEVKFDPVPQVNAGTDITTCTGADSIRLDGFIKNTAKAFWSSSGTGIFTPSFDSLSTYYRPSADDYTMGQLDLTLTPTDVGSCNSISSTIKLQFSPVPTVSAGPDKSVCNTDLPVVLEGSGANSKWLGAGTFSPSEFVLNAQYTPTNAEIILGKATLIIETIKQQACTQSRDTVEILLPNGPTVDAGPDQQSMCANSTGHALNLATNNGVSPTIKWSTASGRGSFVPNEFTLNATFVPVQAQIDNGKATLILETTSNGICKPAKDQINLVITPAPKVDVGQDLTVCADLDTVNLNASFTIGSNVAWQTLGGSGTFDNNTAQNPNYIIGASDKTNGFVNILATTKNVGLCREVTDTLKLVITPAPTVDATASFTACNNATSLGLKVTKTVAQGVLWSTGLSGIISPNIASDSIQYQLTDIDRTASNLKFYVTSTGIGTCKPVTDSVIVSLDKLQTVTAQKDTLICSTKRPQNITATASTAVLWSGGSNLFGNPTQANTTYTMDDNDISSGSALLKIETTNNGVCPKAEDYALIQIIPSPEVVVNAGLDQELCKDNIQTQLQGFVLNAGGGEWTILTGNGSFSDKGILAPIYHFGIGDTSATSVKLLLTSTDNGLCVAVTDTMEVKFTPIPKVSAGLDQTVCEDTAYVNIATSYTVATDHLWTTTGDGFFTPNPQSLNAEYVPGSVDIANKRVNLVVTTKNNGTCIGTYKDEMQVNMLAKPKVNAGIDKYACVNTLTVPLSGLVTNASGLNWTTSGTGVFSPNGTTAKYLPSFNDKVSTKVQLTATSTGNSICKAAEDKMFIFFNKIPIVSAGPDVTYCQTTDRIQLLGRVENNPNVFWLTQETGAFNPSSTVPMTEYILSSEDKLKSELNFTLITRSTTGCSPVSDQVIFTLQPLPAVDPGAVASCAYTDGIQLNGKVVGALGAKWSSILGAGTFAVSEDSLDAKYFLAQPDYTQKEIDLTLTSVGNGVCPADAKTTKLTLNPLPVALAGADQYACTGAKAALSARVFRDVPVYEWTDLSTNTVLGTTPVVVIPSVTGVKSYQLKLVNKYGCIDKDTMVLHSVDPVTFGLKPHYCLTNELEIASAVTNPSPMAVYQWYLDDVLLQDKIDSALLVRSAGHYKVEYSVDRCTYNDTSLVTEPPFLYHKDRIGCTGSNLVVSTNLVPNVTYTWKTGVPNVNTSNVTVLADTNRYLVSALDKLGCTSTDSIRVIGIDQPIVSVKDTAICNKDTIQLRYTFSNDSTLVAYNPEKYWKIPPATDSVFVDFLSVTNTGNYVFHVRVDACVGLDTGKVLVNALPDTVPNSVVNFCDYDGNEIDIDAGAGAGLQYVWNPGAVSDTNRTLHVKVAGLYVVTKTDRNKCSLTDTINVTETCPPRFFLPNAFTPNSDDFDNTMRIFGRNFKNLKLTIFNRWGEIIFYTEDRNTPWDGRYIGQFVENGLYPYMVTYEGLHENDKGPYELRGSVNVIKKD